jgi:hypothetical protein
VAAPSEIAAGVPGDLDALCRMTLNDDSGPMTPGDFASQIAPWARGPVHATVVGPTEVGPTMVLPLPGSGPAARTEPTVVISTESAAQANGSVSAPTVRTSATEVATALGAALAGAGAAAGVVGAKVGSFARAAADKAAVGAGPRADPGGAQMTLREAFAAHSDEAEPPLPMLPASTAQAPSRDQSKVVVTIVAAFVALSLLAAYCGIQGVGNGFSLPVPRP